MGEACSVGRRARWRRDARANSTQRDRSPPTLTSHLAASSPCRSLTLTLTAGVPLPRTTARERVPARKAQPLTVSSPFPPPPPPDLNCQG